MCIAVLFPRFILVFEVSSNIMCALFRESIKLFERRAPKICYVFLKISCIGRTTNNFRNLYAYLYDLRSRAGYI